MPSTNTYMLMGSLAAGAAGSYLSNRAANNRSKQEGDANREMSKEELEAKRLADLQRVALEQSGQNPYRDQLNQAGAISSLDRLQNSSYMPVQLAGGPARYAGNIPQMGGGHSYQKSPELRAAAGNIKNSVMGNQAAPSMTDPNNYGLNAGVTLGPNGQPIQSSTAGLAGTHPGGGLGGRTPNTGVAGPRSSSAWGADGQPVSNSRQAANAMTGQGGPQQEIDALMNNYGRRNEGAGGVMGGIGRGAMTGASVASIVPGVGTVMGAGAGAVIGGIAGAFTKNAKSAATDFSVEDARAVIAQGLQANGRPADPAYIDQMIASSGWKPGHKWVGQQGVQSILSGIYAGQA